MGSALNRLKIMLKTYLFIIIATIKVLKKVQLCLDSCVTKHTVVRLHVMLLNAVIVNNKWCQVALSCLSCFRFNSVCELCG